MKLRRQLYDSELVREYETRLKWLRCEVAIETSPTRLRKLSEQIEIKQRILAELKGL